MSYILKSIFYGVILFGLIYLVTVSSLGCAKWGGSSGGIIGSTIVISLFITSLFFTVYLYKNKNNGNSVSNLPFIHDFTVVFTVLLMVIAYFFVFVGQNFVLAQDFAFGLPIRDFAMMLLVSSVAFIIGESISARVRTIYYSIPKSTSAVLRKMEETEGKYIIKKEDSPNWTKVLSLREFCMHLTMLLGFMAVLFFISLRFL